MNPVLHSFQLVVNKYNIPYEYINAFLTSMKYDLEKKEYKTKLEADEYIYGSADVVGLMCLRVFCDGNDTDFQRLYGPAMRLGSAFQKVNFLRDLKNDAEILGRNYFPQVDYQNFNEPAKQLIVNEIKGDFEKAYVGIKELPSDTRVAVLVAFLYYKALLKKLTNTPAEKIQQTRLRISNFLKITILVRAVIMSKLKMI
jgi:phytoene/squalene synthetase